MPGPYILTRPVDVNSWNPLSGSSGYYDLWQLFAPLRTTAGENSVPTAYIGILSAGTDLSQIFDPSMSAEDQINFLTGLNAQPGGNYLLSGADLKFIFRNIDITPTPSTTPAATPTPTPSVTPAATPSITPTPSKTPTPTPSITPSVTRTPAASVTPTPSVTPTSTVTPTVTPTPTITPTVTPSVTPTVTPSLSVSTTPGITPTSSPIPPSSSPTPTPTSTATPTPTPTPSISVSITPTPTSTPTPSISVSITPTVTPSVTPTITPSPTPTITPSNTPVSSPPVVNLTITGEESVRWYGNSIPLQSTATSSGGQISSYVLQVRYSSTGSFTPLYATFANYTGTLPTSNAVFPASYTPNQGVGFYQFRAFVTVVGNPTTYLSESGVVAVINNNVSINISANIPAAGSTSVNLTSIANSNNSGYGILAHGFEWFNGSSWVNVGEFYPNSQSSTQTVTHNAGNFGTYFYRAYATNCNNFQQVGTYQYSSTIAVTFTDVPVTPTPTPSITPTPTPSPTPIPLTWVNQGLVTPDQFSNIWIKKYFTSGTVNSYIGRLSNPGSNTATITTNSTPQYGINFGGNTTLQIPGNNVINIGGNYDGSIVRSSSETYNRLTITTTDNQEYWLDIILPVSCYWSAGDNISGDTYTTTSIWASNVGGYITQQGTITNPNSYPINLTVDTIINNGGNVTWWQTNTSNTITTGSIITIPAGSTIDIGFINPNVTSPAGLSEILFKGPNQLLNFRAELYNIQQWVVSQNISANKSAWFTAKYVWNTCTPSLETIEGYNVVYIPAAGTYQFQAEVDDSLELYVDGSLVGSIASFQESYKSETPISFYVYLNVGVHVIRTVATNSLVAYGSGVAVELWDPSNNVIWRLRDGSSGTYLDNPGATTCVYDVPTYGDPFTDTNNFINRPAGDLLA